MVSATRWTDLQAVCVSSCPTAGDVVYSSGEICSMDSGCAVTISTVNMNHRCFPTSHRGTWLSGYRVAYDSISDVDFAMYRGMGDSRSSMAAILVCGGVLAFFWAIMVAGLWSQTFFVLEFLFGHAISSVLALVLLLVSFLTRFLIPGGGEGFVDINMACFIFTFVVTIFYMLMLCRAWSFIPFINLSIQTPGANLLAKLQGLFVFVAVMVLLLMWFFSYWLDVAAYLSSSETTVAQYAQSLKEFDSVGYDDDEVTVITTVSDGHVTALMWYHFFGLLWTSEFILCFTVCCICGAVSQVLALADIEGQNPVWASIKRTVCFNLGSVAFGSFLIVLFWPFRVIGGFFKSVLPTQATGILQVLCCCCICMGWCFEQCVKFSNKLAFTMVGEQGLPFCAASRLAIDKLGLAELIWLSSGLQVIFPAMSTPQQLLFSNTTLFISCKLTISICCGFMSWIWAGSMGSVESPLFPVLFTIYLAYFSSGIAFQVMQAVLETIFVSDAGYVNFLARQ